MPEQNIATGAEETIFNTFAAAGLAGILLFIFILAFFYTMKILYRRLLSEDGLITISVREHVALMATIREHLPHLSESMDTQTETLNLILDHHQNNKTKEGLVHMSHAVEELATTRNKDRVRDSTKQARKAFTA